jgi:hypothetical protein
MSIAKPPALDQTLARFDGALSRLEAALEASVAKLADTQRKAGYLEGHAAGLREANVTGLAGDDPAELEAARAREAELCRAVDEARAALKDAMFDIKAVLGPL